MTNQPNVHPLDDIENDDSHPEIQWSENEEIESEFDEHELFLRDEHFDMTKKSFRGNYSRQTSHQSTSGVTSHHNTRPELFHLDDSGLDSSPPSSVAYQIPHHDQYEPSQPQNSPNGSKSRGDGLTDDEIDDWDNDNFAQTSETTTVVHSDIRCRCICPPPLLLTSNNVTSSNERRLYVGNTLPNQCNCDNIVRPQYNETNAKISLKDFCLRCSCKYQVRDKSMIRRNVLFFMVILAGLAFYLLVQYILKHFRITRRSLSPRWRWLSHQMTSN